MLKKVNNQYVLAHGYFGLLQLEDDHAFWPTGDNMSQLESKSSWEIFKDIDKVQDAIASR